MYPNAHQGIEKIGKAVRLFIIAAALSAVAGLAALISENLALVGGVAVLAACVLIIIALIRKISGVKCASKDEPAFKTAFYVLIVGIAAAVVTGVFNSTVPVLGAIGSFTSTITEILAGYFICTGILKLSDTLGDSAVGAKSRQVRTLLICAWGITAVLDLVSFILRKNTGVVGVITIVSAIITIVGFIFYYDLLTKAGKMLA